MVKVWYQHPMSLSRNMNLCHQIAVIGRNAHKLKFALKLAKFMQKSQKQQRSRSKHRSVIKRYSIVDAISHYSYHFGLSSHSRSSLSRCGQEFTCCDSWHTSLLFFSQNPFLDVNQSAPLLKKSGVRFCHSDYSTTTNSCILGCRILGKLLGSLKHSSQHPV